jgi:RHS repeat-associated protein
MGNVTQMKKQKGSHKGKNSIDELITYYEYNYNGQLTKETNPIGATTSFAYDYVDRLINTTDALGNKMSMTYTKDSQVSSATDANGNKTSYQYNLLGNVTKEISALGNEVNYTYDAVGNLSEIHQYKGVSAAIRSTMSDAKGYDATLEEVINTYAYNTNGQLIKEVNPSGSMVEYKYDATGNLISKTDEDGYTTTYLYDQVNNLVKETYGDGKETTYTYNPLNQVISMTDWLGTNTYDLDVIGRLKSVRDYKNRTTAYTWDGESNRTSITYPDRSTVNYTYDQKGQLITVTDENKGITSYTYDKLGNVLSEKLANGDKTTYSYDVLSRLNTITAKDSNGNLLYNNEFEYDAVGNKTSGIEEVSKNNNGNNNSSNNNSSYNRNENGYKSEYETITYVYDALDQLIKVTNPDNSVEKYFYDTLGNRVQKEITIPGKNENKESTTNVTKYTYNKDNQMLTLQGIEEEVALHQTSDLVNFEYDGRGNTVKISTQEGIIGQYRYDATNKMTHAINKKGIRSEYIYDGAGRRVTQKVEEPNINVPEKSSLHDAAYFEEKFRTSSTEDIDYKKEMNYIVDITSLYNNVLKVYGEHTKTQRYTYGLDVISMDTWHEKAQDNGIEKDNDKTLYYINNELGSVVTLVDGKDKVKVEYSYDTFGVVAEKNHVNDQSIRSNIFHYTGYQYDYQTGLYFANARYYIAEVGRFAEEDVYKGDGLNRYVYVRSNPIRYVDRSGYSRSEGTGYIDVGVHRVLNSNDYHTCIIIYIDKRSKYYEDDDRFMKFDNSGVKYATIGAGGIPLPWGKLESSTNREQDIVLSIKVKYYPIIINGSKFINDDMIDKFFEYEKNYRRDKKNYKGYEWFPEKDDKKYNSNSFAHGLLIAVGADDIPDVSKDYSVPGWKKPVPTDAFN